MTDCIAPDHWNGWRLDPDIPALIYDTEHFVHYQIDLDRMLTAGDIVFWTIQVGGKPWPGALVGFINAVDDLYEPHRNIYTMPQVGSGKDAQQFTPESIRAAVATFAAAEVRHHSKWISAAEAGVL